MTALDAAVIEFELHADLLQRALGRRGAPACLQCAQAELRKIHAALWDVAGEIVRQRAHGAAK